MAQRKGQTGNPGGRPKGTPNKATRDLKEWVNLLIDKNLPKLEKDLKALEPKERWTIVERLMQYTIPKQQSVSVEAQIQAEYESLENLLKNASEEAIDEITQRIIRLNEAKHGNGETDERD